MCHQRKVGIRAEAGVPLREKLASPPEAKVQYHFDPRRLCGIFTGSVSFSDFSKRATVSDRASGASAASMAEVGRAQDAAAIVGASGEDTETVER